MMKTFSFVFLLVFSVSCGDETPENIYIPPGGTDSSNPSNSQNDMQVDLQNDMGVDEGVSDMGTDGPQALDDMSMDLPGEEDVGVDPGEVLVEVCEFPDRGTYMGNCDVVRSRGCASGLVCTTAQILVGPDVFLGGACLEPDREYVLEEFSDCEGTTERCALGLTCFFGTCRKLCYTETGAGCMEDQYCRQPSRTWPGLGYCASQCVGPG